MSFFENTRKPVGLGGKIMVAMMNFGHSAMAEWGLSFLQPAPDAMNATAVRQTEADTKTDWAQGLTEQQEVETEIEKAVSADTLDRLQQDAAELLEEYETAKLDGTEEEAVKLNEAYERVLAEINAMLG